MNASTWNQVVISDETEELVNASIASSTVETYQLAMQQLEKWLDGLSLSDNLFATYITELYQNGKSPATISKIVAAVAASGVKAEKQTPPEGGASMTQTIATIESRGIKRLLREVLWLCGKVIFKNGRVVCIIVNPLYPFIDRIITAFRAFLKPYKIRVLLDET